MRREILDSLHRIAARSGYFHTTDLVEHPRQAIQGQRFVIYQVDAHHTGTFRLTTFQPSVREAVNAAAFPKRTASRREDCQGRGLQAPTPWQIPSGVATLICRLPLLAKVRTWISPPSRFGETANLMLFSTRRLHR
jgi:hypothetical protein